MGNDSEAYGLSGKSKSADRMDGLLARLEKIKQFAGENEILTELKSKLKRAQWLFDSKKADSQGDYRDVINALMLLQLYSRLSDTASHLAEVQSSVQSLPVLFQHVMANDPDKLRGELHTLIEPVVVSNIQGKHNGSSQELKDEFLKEKRSQLIAELYPNTSFSSKEQCSNTVFHQTMVLVSGALLYLINISGGKQRFLDTNSEIGHVLLHTIHQLHEIYPLEVRRYLLSMDPRARVQMICLLDLCLWMSLISWLKCCGTSLIRTRYLGTCYNPRSRIVLNKRFEHTRLSNRHSSNSAFRNSWRIKD